MRKKIISIVLVLTFMISAFTISASASFSDISDPDTAVAAAVLESMGIVTGTGTNTYSPNSTLTRAEFCTLVVRAMGVQDQVATYARKTLFSDVSPDFWYAGYVNLAYSKSVINGYGNGMFGPDDNVTYGRWQQYCCGCLVTHRRKLAAFGRRIIQPLQMTSIFPRVCRWIHTAP